MTYSHKHTRGLTCEVDEKLSTKKVIVYIIGDKKYRSNIDVFERDWKLKK